MSDLGNGIWARCNIKKDNACSLNDMKGHSDPVPSTLGLEHERKIFISLAKCAYFVYFYYWTHSLNMCLPFLLKKVFNIFLPDMILLHSKKTSNNWQLELQKTNTCSVAQLCLTLCDPMQGSPFPTPFPTLDPGIKPTSLCLLHWQLDSLPLHLGSTFRRPNPIIFTYPVTSIYCP